LLSVKAQEPRQRNELGEQKEQFSKKFMLVCTGREQDRPRIRLRKVRKKRAGREMK